MSLEFEFQPQRPSAEKLRTMEADQWQYLVSRIDDAATAKLIVEYLDDDPVRRHSLAGIYLRARDTLQRSRYGSAKSRSRAGLFAWLVRSPSIESSPACSGAQRETPPQLVWPTLNIQ